MENQPSATGPSTTPPQRTGVLDRKMSVRWALILIGIVVVVALILWALKAIECGRSVGSYQAALRKSTTQSAKVAARAIAVVGNRDVAARRYESLQDCADKLARGKPLLFIAIVDRSGLAVVHTDRSLLAKPWKAPAERPDEVVAEVRVMDFTDEVAKVYVGARLPRR